MLTNLMAELQNEYCLSWFMESTRKKNINRMPPKAAFQPLDLFSKPSTPSSNNVKAGKEVLYVREVDFLCFKLFFPFKIAPHLHILYLSRSCFMHLQPTGSKIWQ